MKRRRTEYITWKEMNKHLDYCYHYRKIIEEEYNELKPLGLFAYVENRTVNFKLTYKYGTKASTYCCRKDGEDGKQFTDGLESYSILQHYYKCPDMRQNEKICKGLLYDNNSGKFLASARPLLYFNKKYNKTRNYAIGYDLNSSYPAAMLNPMPDTSVDPRTGVVNDGEVGFKEDEEGNFIPVFTGHFSLWVFPLMETPFTRFVEKWWNKKASSESEEEKLKAKGVLNYCVGYLQKTNPFLRSMIVYYANKRILDIIDEDTLYCNTDSIVSLKEKNIDIGKKLGQFKVERRGNFAYNGFNYQWDDDVPSYRHISKAWFKRGFDILVDKPPKEGNVVEYKNYQLKEIAYGYR